MTIERYPNETYEAFNRRKMKQHQTSFIDDIIDVAETVIAAEIISDLFSSGDNSSDDSFSGGGGDSGGGGCSGDW